MIPNQIPAVDSLFLGMVGPILVVFCLSALFVAFGKRLLPFLLTQTDREPSKSEPALEFALSYGIGLITLITLWLFLDLFLKNAHTTFLFTIGIMLVGSAYRPWSNWHFSGIFSKTSLIGIGLFLVFIPYNLSKALRLTWERMPQDLTTVDKWDGVGVIAHTFRAANISIFIHENNYIPVLPQHIGQSLLAVTPSFFGFHCPLYSLLIWHAAITAFLIFSIYAIARVLSNSVRMAFLVTVVASVGNVTFSPHEIKVTDIGSVPVVMQSIDAIVGLATMLLFAIVTFRRILKDGESGTSLLELGGLFCLVVTWCITATQNLILAPALPVAAFAARFLQKRQIAELFPKNRIQGLFLVGVFVVAGILGSLRGGMFSPASCRERLIIPGVIQVKQENKKPIEFRRSEILSYTNGRYNGPASFALSCYYVMFPIAGIVLFSIVSFQRDTPIFDKAFLLATTGLFVFGIFVQSTLVMYGHYWELSRFLYLGILLAMIALGMGMLRSASWIAPRSPLLATLLSLPFISLVCFGHLTIFLKQYWEMIIYPIAVNGELGWRQPIEFLLTVTQYVGKN